SQQPGLETSRISPHSRFSWSAILPGISTDNASRSTAGSLRGTVSALLGRSVQLAGARSLPAHLSADDRAGHRELLILGTYFALVILITDALNVRPGIEVCIAMVAVAGVAITRQPLRF